MTGAFSFHWNFTVNKEQICFVILWCKIKVYWCFSLLIFFTSNFSIATMKINCTFERNFLTFQSICVNSFLNRNWNKFINTQWQVDREWKCSTPCYFVRLYYYCYFDSSPYLYLLCGQLKLPCNEVIYIWPNAQSQYDQWSGKPYDGSCKVKKSRLSHFA